MKNLTLLILVVVCALAASGQASRQKKNEKTVKPMARITDHTSPGSSAFGAAAVQVDGEVIGKLPMRFEIAPDSLEVIVP